MNWCVCVCVWYIQQIYLSIRLGKKPQALTKYIMSFNYTATKVFSNN